MNEQALAEELAGILLDNASFWREDEKDDSLYFVDATTIIHLAYECIQVAANVLGVGIPVISGALLLRKRIKNKSLDSGSEVKHETRGDHLDASQAAGGTTASNKQVEIVQGIKAVLMRHGWPEREAQADAEESLRILRNHLDL